MKRVPSQPFKTSLFSAVFQVRIDLLYSVDISSYVQSATAKNKMSH